MLCWLDLILIPLAFIAFCLEKVTRIIRDLLNWPPGRLFYVTFRVSTTTHRIISGELFQSLLRSGLKRNRKIKFKKKQQGNCKEPTKKKDVSFSITFGLYVFVIVWLILIASHRKCRCWQFFFDYFSVFLFFFFFVFSCLMMILHFCSDLVQRKEIKKCLDV